MAIDTDSKLVKGLSEAQRLFILKPTITGRTAGEFASLWRAHGFPPAGLIPTTPEVCDRNTRGSWRLQDIIGANEMRSARFAGASSVFGQLIKFDRLAHMGGLSGTVTGVQPVNLNIVTPAAQGRCLADGSNVSWWLEWYVATGTGTPTVTVTYTNQAGVSGRTTTLTLLASRPASFTVPILPHIDDLCIRSIESLQLATTGTAGNFGVTARRHINELTFLGIGVGDIADFAKSALPPKTGNECLEMICFCNGTGTGNIIGSIAIIQG